MILAGFEALLDQVPPAWVRRVEVAVLMRVFAEAFDVEAPATERVSADEALRSFREFTAACMEAVLESGQEEAYRARLHRGAYELGCRVRGAHLARRSQAFRLTRFLYRGIGIELEGDLDGEMRFGPCSFAQRYTACDCALMSAFDAGFICGVAGRDLGELAFSCRLTEGAPCCKARLAS